MPGEDRQLFLFRPFAEADRFWSDFKYLIFSNIFNGLFQRKTAGRGQSEGLVRAAGPDVGQLFLFAGIDVKIIPAGVFAKDQAGINRIARAGENSAPGVQEEESVGNGLG